MSQRPIAIAIRMRYIRGGYMDAHITFTLLSSPALISKGCPGTHSTVVTAPSWAPRTRCSRRPPALRSQRAICPVDDADAKTGCPSGEWSTKNTPCRHVGFVSPLRKDSALIPPSCIVILINRSSVLMSYTEISPDEKPIPTTSMAGDCTKAVIATEEVDEEDGCVRREAVGKVCIRVLIVWCQTRLRASSCLHTEYGCSTVAYFLDCCQ